MFKKRRKRAREGATDASGSGSRAFSLANEAREDASQDRRSGRADEDDGPGNKLATTGSRSPPLLQAGELRGPATKTASNEDDGDDDDDGAVLVPVSKLGGNKRASAGAGSVSASSGKPAVTGHALREAQEQTVSVKSESEKLQEQEKQEEEERMSKTKKPTGRYGPRSATANIKTTVMMDYQPDVCKDYKETGYCGFGDSCKFIHDRGDYKSGWELEKEWQLSERKRKDDLRAGILGDDEDEAADADASGGKKRKRDIPFACHLCRQPFTKPVVTLCGHYFCRKCAFAHNAKSGRCAVCGKPTKGIFNAADEIIANT
ncbi:Pre-mRNA-splicing factor CWC24 [Hondaea fermentalgiana]|uniref:Pre-mRNA-splicing factor CWC24 n=1 Tax=Hondaea fermentalgiana TaxID=2315210 RepID=A0A2R5G843_9STRA|nr:Pre-mRNA-splicing factor CWC24 [Hondaea fermentalgiana]|eukprot:GBG23864.1 Pre-mRNA-splicing factor CWC24 [Hondaea fermentalgiana]